MAEMEKNMDYPESRHPVPGLCGPLVLVFLWLLPFVPFSFCGTSQTLSVFTNVSIIPMNDEELLEHRDVFVLDGKILAITPTGQKGIPKDASIIDGKGRFLLPGLVDAHVHLLNEKCLQLFLMNGVTTVRVMEGKPEHLAWRKRIEDGELRGPHLVVSTPILHGEESERFHYVHTPEQARTDVRRFHDEGYDWVKVLRLDRNVLAAVIEEANKWKMPVGGHVPNFELNRFYGEEVKASAEPIPFDEVLKSGMASLEHLGEVAMAEMNGSLDPERIPEFVKLIRESGITITPTIRAGMMWNEALSREEDFLDADRRRRIGKYLGQDMLTRAEKALQEIKTYDADTRKHRTNNISFAMNLLKASSDAGVHLVAGSDTGGFLSIPGFSLIGELEVYVQAGLTPYRALRAATLEGALLLNRGATNGTVEAGKNADLILVKENPLKDIRALRGLEGVMFNGHWLSRDNLKRIDDSFTP